MPSYSKAVARFINAAFLSDGDITAKIDSISEIELDGNDRLVVTMKGVDKGLVLNRTNGDVLADAFGDELNDWVGKEITLYKDRCQMRGKMVDCVRVKVG